MSSENTGQLAASPPPPLAGADLFFRLAVIAMVVGGIAGLFLYTGGWFTPHALTPAAMIDTFEHVNGIHPGFRRNHAKGVCVTGYFESNGRGVALSKALVFQTGRIPVVGRFGFSGGLPYVTDDPHTVRSLALLFKLPNGEEWRTAMVNIPVFVVNSAQGFHDLLLASAPDPASGKPDPAKMGAFIGAHPEFAKAIQLVKSQTVSSGFADATYNALNTFRFINEQGADVPVRWGITPSQPFKPLADTKPPSGATNYMFDTLIADIHTHPLQWHLMITVGKPGDPTSDPSLPWPPDREQVDAGTVTIEQIESEDTSPTRDINFDPLVLPNGITTSDDTILSARSAAYSQSFTRREGEAKTPSAISPAETAK